MPEVLVRRLHSEIETALRTPAVRDKLVAQGSEVVGSSPQEFRQFIVADIAKWAKVIKASGAKPD